MLGAPSTHAAAVATPPRLLADVGQGLLNTRRTRVGGFTMVYRGGRGDFSPRLWSLKGAHWAPMARKGSPAGARGGPLGPLRVSQGFTGSNPSSRKFWSIYLINFFVFPRFYRITVSNPSFTVFP